MLEVSEHALGRLYQRSPRVAASAVLTEAVHAFLAADMGKVAEASRRGETVYLPAGSGLLLCAVIAEKPRIVVRANTFLAAELAGPDQRAVAAAVDFERSVLAASVRGGF